MARSTGNKDADRAVAAMWLAEKGYADPAVAAESIRQDMAGKTREEIEEVRDAIKNSMTG